MAIRLDPYQNIVGVNWGRLLVYLNVGIGAHVGTPDLAASVNIIGPGTVHNAASGEFFRIFVLDVRAGGRFEVAVDGPVFDEGGRPISMTMVMFKGNVGFNAALAGSFYIGSGPGHFTPVDFNVHGLNFVSLETGSDGPDSPPDTAYGTLRADIAGLPTGQTEKHLTFQPLGALVVAEDWIVPLDP